MSLKRLITAGLLGLSVSLTAALPTLAQNTLSVLRGTTSGAITVEVNRAIVVESQQTFAELSVANPGIADIATLSDKTIYVLGKSPGTTTLTLLDPEGKLIANVDVRVRANVDEFKQRLKEVFPGENIEVRTANDGIVLSGRVSGARVAARAVELATQYIDFGENLSIDARVKKITNLMMVGGSQQVLLKVRFAEMQRSVAKNLGGALGIEWGAGQKFDTTLSTPDSGGSLDLNFSLGGAAIDIMIDALEQKQMARILAEPNLVALSGQTASFLAGSEYPVPAADGAVDFRPVGVQLTFKPTVIEGDLINLDLSTVVSSLDTTASTDTANGGTKSITTSRAQTTVEMRDGQSFAIAGLLQETFADGADQVPWLGDLPVLGALFRSAEFERKQTELVVIITPYLVNPTSTDALSLPTDTVRIPTEEELFLMGRTEGSADGFSLFNQEGQSASGGYVLE